MGGITTKRSSGGAEAHVRDRVIGHVAVGVAALAIFAVLISVVGSLVAFVTAIGAFYIGLRSFTFAISIGLGDPWGWTRDQGLTAPSTWSDRIVMAGVNWARRRSLATHNNESPGPVRVLPPKP